MMSSVKWYRIKFQRGYKELAMKTQQAVKLIRHSLYISMELHTVKTALLEWWSFTVDFIHSLSNVVFIHLSTTKNQNVHNSVKLEKKNRNNIVSQESNLLYFHSVLSPQHQTFTLSCSFFMLDCAHMNICLHVCTCAHARTHT